MHQQPLVSVILNVHNGADYLSGCIRSVLNQTYENFELIIADDASTDNTLEIIRSFDDRRIRCLTRPTRRHICFTVNEALAEAKGEWIAHIDHDDLWAPDKLEKQMAYVLAHPDVGACFTFARLIGGAGEPVGDRYPERQRLFHTAFDSRRDWARQFLFRGNCLCHSSALLRAGLFDGLDLFCRQLHDFELWCRLLPKTGFYVVPEELTLYRWADSPEQGSYPSRENTQRTCNETQLVTDATLLDGLSDGQLIECFREDFRYPDAATPLELKIERAFLCSAGLPGGGVWAPTLARLAAILREEGAVGVLEEKYGLPLPRLYELTCADVLRTPLTDREQAGARQALEEAQARQASLDAELAAALAELEEQRAALDGVRKELARTGAELADYQREYAAAIRHRDLLRHDLDQVLRSRCWRWTAPLRSLSGALRRLLHRMPHVLLICKALRMLLRRGPRETWRAVRAHRAQVRKIRRLSAAAPAQAPAPMAAPSGFDCDPGELQCQREASFSQAFKFSILVPLYNTPEPFLREMIASVQEQTYPNWELCLADGSDAAHARVGEICRALAGEDDRIVYRKLEQNLGIAANTNACFAMATGDYVGLLDHDDLLHPGALYEIMRCLEREPADVIYSDEIHLRDGVYCAPLYKPDWSPDLLRTQNYVCHFLTFRRTLLPEGEVFRGEFDGAQDYDLILRLSERTGRIAHVARCLYAWREHSQSTAANAGSKPYANEAGRRALDAHLKRCFGPEAYAADGDNLFTYVPRFPLGERKPLVSIVIPFKDKPRMTETCLRSILDKTAYQNYEILLLNNRSEEAETARWLEKAAGLDPRVRVLEADFPFNWSRLNNFGAAQARGEVLVFLNNDTRVISPDWLELLAENALREDMGVVGALLLYPDGTIQHAGVVVGMNGWADHVFKGVQPVHSGTPFISPVCSRNVLAVTGACQAVSRRVFDRLGGYDEDFIVCGSDVDICLRARKEGLSVLYDARVRLYHDESKSRDPRDIPEVDFRMSERAYGSFRTGGDPYYNPNLDYNSTTPCLKGQAAPEAAAAPRQCALTGQYVSEIRPIRTRADGTLGKKYRLNLLVPSICQQHVFGGISTALKFLQAVCDQTGVDTRIVLVDFAASGRDLFGSYRLVRWNRESASPHQVVNLVDRSEGQTLCVGENDIFLATAWWTAYMARGILKAQAERYGTEHDLLYFIQDYEPYFYAWSSQYSLAESTYHLDVPTTAIFNSTLLKEYFDREGYAFHASYCFDATMNASLFAALDPDAIYERKKQIIFYGRPGTPRNCFELVIKALEIWCAGRSDLAEWTVYSVGEQHEDILFDNGFRVCSLGKLTLEQYANLMKESYAAISLMVSPHPSYPPLEMSTFGVRTITNCYANKDLTGFNDSIISLRHYAPKDIAAALDKLCDGYEPRRGPSVNPDYCSDKDVWSDIIRAVTAGWN